MKRLALITILALGLAHISSHADAKTLKCFTRNDYTATTITVNRDGSIGFNGTFITINSQSGILGNAGGPGAFLGMKMLTGRDADQEFMLHGVVLPLSPKGVCTPENDSPSESFSCVVKKASVDLIGKASHAVHDGSPVEFESLEKRERIDADVELEANYDSSKKALSITATLTEPKSGRTVFITKNDASCEVTDH